MKGTFNDLPTSPQIQNHSQADFNSPGLSLSGSLERKTKTNRSRMASSRPYHHMLVKRPRNAAKSAQNFKQAMNNQEPNSKNSLKENCFARQSAESALDALHTEAIETELQKLERMEAGDPGPWKLDSQGYIRNAEHGFAVWSDTAKAFIIALRNAAKNLIWQAKNISVNMADLDEVHAALGIDYSESAGAAVQQLVAAKQSLLDKDEFSNRLLDSADRTIQYLKEQNDIIARSLRIEQTLNKNLRGTAAALRDKAESLEDWQGLQRCNLKQADTILDLTKQIEGLCQKLRKLQDERDKALEERSVPSVLNENRNLKESLDAQAETIRKLRVANEKQGYDIIQLRESERTLAINNDTFAGEVTALKGDVKALREREKQGEKITLCGSIGRKVRCQDGKIREIRVVSATECKYYLLSKEDGRRIGIFWHPRCMAEKLVAGGTVVDD